MPSFLRGAASVCLCVFVGWSLHSGQCGGADVWSGLTRSFSKPDGADGSLPANQDTLTPGVIFARGYSGGLYNAESEPNWIDTSPEFTEWATDLVAGNDGEEIIATNFANLQFTSWLNAYGNGGDEGLHTRIQGRSAVVHLTLDDVYLDLKFSYWGAGHFGGNGGFSYMRAQPPAPEPTGDYNGDLTVNAADYTLWRDTLGSMVANLGDGADGNRSGTIDLPDYDHWKARFGNMVPTGAGASGASAVPEPSVITLLLPCVLGLYRCCTLRRASWRG